MLLKLALITFLLAILLLWQAGKHRQKAGLPGGRVIYTDTQGWGPVDEPLYDPVYDLTGKPDYLVQQGKQIIPVEVKTGRTPDAPYDSHIFQLAAYCFLVDRTFGHRPAYGIIKYPNRIFTVEYTASLENKLIDLLGDIHNYQRLRNVDRSHNNPARCGSCGYSKICDQRIG